MRCLLDTQAFLWLAADDPRIPSRAIALFADTSNECFLSATSVWEMAIKASLGKLILGTALPSLVRGGIERGMRILDVTADHAFLTEHLAFHHRDPFDRLLVAQVTNERMHLVSGDAIFDAYGVARIWT